LIVLASIAWAGCASAPPAPAATASDAKTEQGPSSIPVTEALGHPHIGEQAPDFELPDQDGKLVKLSSLRGSVVVLALVSSWCPFSKAEQSYLAKLGSEYAPRGVRTVGVVVADTEDGYNKYLARTNMPFPMLRDAGDAVALAYAPDKAMPSFKDRRKVVVTANLVIDAQGMIEYFALVDTLHFDTELSLVRSEVDRLLKQGS
jgi:peroxiredoxin